MKPQTILTAILIASLLLAVAPCETCADGVIVPIEPSPVVPRLGQFYSVKYHRVQVEIKEQVVATTVEQAFINETGRPVEVEYLFPLPRNSSVNRFTLIVDGKEIAGRILDKDEARRIYDQIVRRRRDPALLEYVDSGMLRTSVFPLPAKGERAVKLVYTELIKSRKGAISNGPDGNLFEYVYPLNTEKFSHKVLEEMRVDFQLDAGAPIKNVYSPTHTIDLDWNGDRSVKGHWSDEGVRPANDFRLFWTLSEDRVGATLFSYRPDASEDGYFLLLASPWVPPWRDPALGGIRYEDREAIPKNLQLVMDVSGSMSGEKIEQARNAARFIVENLNPDDHFNIIFYNSVVDPLWNELHRPISGARSEAANRIGKVQAGGSTDINAALTTALKQIPGDDRPGYVIFLTDGLPTAGVTDLNKIVENVETANEHGSRVFVFGVGFDVNAVLLDRLGADNHGIADYVPPGENIEAKVSSFYSKIRNPALADLVLDFGGIRVRDTYPQNLPDLFYGGQLVLAGRYRDAGKQKVVLKGTFGDEKPVYSYEFGFTEKSDPEEYAFVARIWAQKKIAWLIEQIRWHGTNQEYVDEIVALSKRYGIMTQYTSFLAEEDVDIARDLRPLREEAWRNMDSVMGFETGAQGVSQSMQSKKLAASEMAPATAGYIDATGREVQVEKIKIIGSKTFYLKKGEWIDAEYKEGMGLTEVKLLSDAYFDLADRSPEQAKYLTFAPDQTIITVIDGKAYKIIPDIG